MRHAWTLVARREVATRLTDRTFLVGTLLTLAIIVALLAVQAVLADRVKDYDVVADARRRRDGRGRGRPGRRASTTRCA